MSDMKEAIEMGIRNSLCWAVPIIQQDLLITIAEHRRPSVLYRPEIYADGNQWCALLGPDLQTGVAGFGSTPAAAMDAFDKAWATESPPEVKLSMTPSLVRQKHPKGCQIAVLAMVLGVTYEEALARVIPDGGDPEGSTWLETWLADAGWAVAKKYRWINPGKKERPKWPLDPWADLHYVNVQYSSASGLSHAVLMLADGTVLDPGHDEPRRLSDYFAVNSMSALAPVRSLESVSGVKIP